MKYQKKFIAPRVEDKPVSKALASIDREFSLVAAAINAPVTPGLGVEIDCGTFTTPSADIECGGFI